MGLKITGRRKCPDVSFFREPDVVLSRFAYRRGAARMTGVEILHHHSPTGPNWGYAGSGPADAALSILAHCLPVGCDGERPVELWKGECSCLAWILHQSFKRRFVARVPEAGGVILGEAVDAWLDEQLATRDGADGEGAADAEG
jgi:hypothetical protein